MTRLRTNLPFFVLASSSMPSFHPNSVTFFGGITTIHLKYSFSFT